MEKLDGIFQKVVIFNGNEVLILKQSSRGGMIKNDQWDLPGGKPKKDEILQKAIRREVREETSLEVNEFFLVTAGIEKFKPKGKRLGLVYFAETDRKQIKVDPEEHSDFQWINVKKIHDKNFAFKNTPKWIEMAKNLKSTSK